jgi:hypothetical protein
MTLHANDEMTLNERFAAQGYLHVPTLGVSDADVTKAGALLDGLFDRFSSLPRRYAHDLGGGQDPENPVLPEILDVSTLEPRLRRSPVFKAARTLARELLGPDAYLVYDHAIYKPPGKAGTTSWHQDSGFDDALTESLAIWIPFQDTAPIDGAMRYVPHSHLGGPLPHLSRTGTDGKTVKYLEIDETTAVDVPCALGGATLHDLHMVHGAGPNLGSQVRRAWVLDFVKASRLRRAVSSVRHVVLARRLAGG